MSLTGRAAYLSLLPIYTDHNISDKLHNSWCCVHARFTLEQAAVAVLTFTESPLPTKTELANI